MKNKLEPVHYLHCHVLIIGHIHVFVVVISSKVQCYVGINFIFWQNLWDLLFELSLLALKSPVRKHNGGNSRHGSWKVLVWC